MSKKSQTTKNKSQSGKFIDAARAAECDESEAAFDAKLKKIGAAKPEPEEKPKKKAKK